MCDLNQVLSLFIDRIELPNNWQAYYGLTQKRLKALWNGPKGKDSFFNPLSETALTMLMLGNFSFWDQVNSLNDCPRISSKWSRSFFRDIMKEKDIYTPKDNINKFWNINKEISKKFTGNRNISMANGILLFEFELPNKDFNQHNQDRFQQYSFIKNNVQPSVLSHK